MGAGHADSQAETRSGTSLSVALKKRVSAHAVQLGMGKTKAVYQLTLGIILCSRSEISALSRSSYGKLKDNSGGFDAG